MRTVARALLCVTVMAAGTAPARAQEEAPAAHVRGTDSATALLVHDLIERSPTGRLLIEQLDRSDLIVYVRYRWFTSTTLRGRIGFLAKGGKRLVAIELATRHAYLDQLAALGHELQHAVEIAAEPTVSDPVSLAELYNRIGQPMGQTAGSYETYETNAAAEAGRRVRRELFQTPAQAVNADEDRH
jgi:hypothetical protein